MPEIVGVDRRDEGSPARRDAGIARRCRAISATLAAVPSVEPSSTTMISRSWKLCPMTLASVASIVASAQ
jgi:hypothetical protein